jgi:S1-C subfamily serine protease
MPTVAGVEKKASTRGNALLWIVATLAGAGAGVNTVTNQITNAELANSKTTIERLNQDLANEQSANIHQARQLQTMTDELMGDRRTIDSLTQSLEQSRSTIQGLNGQVSELNRNLSSRITLDQMVTAVSMITPSTVRVEGQFGLGSGVILFGSNGERYILTNGHVTEGNEMRRNLFQDGVYHIKVYNGSDYKNPIEFDAAPVMLSNGNRAFSRPGEHDLALLAIPPDVKLPANITGIRFRDINAHPLRVGEPVIAVGNPFGERDSVSIGSISHIDRSSNLNINHHIQTDAPINPGNSGGGLFSIRLVDGRPVVELIGINTWGYRGGDGIGGSIRADYIQQVLNGWGVSLRK